jgi:hypothetical protein
MIRTRTLAAMGTAMLLTSSAVFAQSPSSSSKQLIVTSASVDRSSDTVTFKGSGFGAKKPAVFCELTQMTVLSASDEELLVSFPASVLDGTFLFTVARGNSANERAAFYVTTSRPQVLEGKEGPAGPQGAAGPAGPQGPKGDKGDTGVQGEQGLKGDTGDTGAQGAKGDTGATGAAGPQGAEGPQGPQGAPGPQGSAGPQGVAGPTGPQGAQGPMGPIGPAGPQGLAGADGISGFERVVGDSGTLQMGAGISSYVVAVCPAGKRPIAGGHELVSIGSQQLNVTMSAPYETIAAVGWRVSFRNGTTNSLTNVQVRAHVVCAVLQ